MEEGDMRGLTTLSQITKGNPLIVMDQYDVCLMSLQWLFRDVSSKAHVIIDPFPHTTRTMIVFKKKKK
jgi:hypothetical protein